MLLVNKITIDIFYYIIQNTLSYRGFSGKLYTRLHAASLFCDRIRVSIILLSI